MSVAPRLNRLFGADGKCFSVAIDHGFFGELSFLKGIEDMKRAVETVVRAAPDVVQLAVGQARHLQNIPGNQKPSLALRTDTANVYGSTLPEFVFDQMMEDAVEQAVALDAACVVVNLLLAPDEPELHAQCVANLCRIKPDCEVYGMPLMVEPLVFRPNAEAGGYTTDRDIDKIMPLVRQAVELGADVIKADPSEDVSEYHRVVEVASGVPVLVRGGGRVSDEEILKRTKALMDQGARGIVYGRNIIQHEHPERMTAALMAIVHEDADVARAQAILAGK